MLVFGHVFGLDCSAVLFQEGCCQWAQGTFLAAVVGRLQLKDLRHGHVRDNVAKIDDCVQPLAIV